MYFSDIHNQILYTLKSNTLAEMTDSQIAGYLDNMLIRAIADFRFPQIPLTYKPVEVEEEITNGTSTAIVVRKDFIFDQTPRQKEINVLLVLVKKFWLEHQIDSENFYEETYYDRDVKMYSRANLLKTLQSRYELAIKECKTSQYNYSRVLNDGGIAAGGIYE